ncbi:YgiW/YdeI family stress tolerance OB fold protein [Orrella marina]|uniref:Uncharacterized protein n=1 Tax=Orrella marina TaxID=2163011 RepID=A0A2R4XNF0_9BURK|nr:NirD/YgiW/YdeI family stress tolerance protein [Orrella marina]AWB35323.1 hypothetical protein DBV39_18035 [Orrella marina]
MKRISFRTVLTGSAAATIIAFSSGVMAQYQGPSASESRAASRSPAAQETVRTVQWVKDTGRDDQKVLLRGRVVNRIGDDNYTFADESGELRVEIDDDVFGAQSVDENTLVEIWGEIDFDDGRLKEIEVKSLRVLR